MYFIATIFIGWAILNTCIGMLEFLFQLEPGDIQEVVLIYIIIGYMVMFLYKIKSPLTPKDNQHPLFSMKKIELNLFFKDLYYAIWWPYYILTKK
jgi:hypothetical protein